MPATPPMSLPRLFSALARTEPSSNAIFPMLELFLRSKEEHKLLVQLEGSAAVYVADILDKFVDVFMFCDLPEYRKRILRLLRSLCAS